MCPCCWPPSRTPPTAGAEMAIVLGPNQYGKAEVRLVHVDRSSARHRITDLTVTTQLRGDFEGTHLTGDNSAVLPTDTQKNTVYALAREHGVGAPEEFALRLGRHFVTSTPHVTGARIAVDAHPWARIAVDGEGHDHAFRRDGGERRTTVVTLDGDECWVVSGLTDLVLLKSTGSEFSGFARDGDTTLAETTPRPRAPAVTPGGRDVGTALAHDVLFPGIGPTLLDTFARLHSLAL